MKSSNLIKILPLAVLFLSISRGLIALAGVVSTQILYYGVTTFGISISLIGIIKKRSHIVGGRNLYLILMINLFSYIYWIATDMLLGGGKAEIYYFVQMALIPFIIYMFLDVDENVLVRMLFVVTVIVSASCVLDFILLNTDSIPNGIDLYSSYQSKIRQGGSPLFYNVAGVYRAMGITAYMHDTGNLMAILVVFWFGMIMTRRGLRYVIISMPLFIVALAMTFSAANILAALAGVVAVIIYQVSSMRLKNISPLIVIFIVGSIICILIDYFYNFDWSLTTKWILKLQNATEWELMTRIGMSDFWADIFMLFAGHNVTTHISNISFITEFSVLKMAYTSGLFILMISLLLMLYPVLCFFKSSRHTRKMMLPAVAAVAVGVLSLWHYGSLLRSTNIFLFYTMFAIAIQNKARNHLSNDKIHRAGYYYKMKNTQCSRGGVC